ncbi:hypothetical protein FOMPIDRAFT_89175 [Fomitopsis schrenkii]|uniref:Uncharacterized protein n=1 Tax=Fomitopsis schrenkii TaxID=2126942 RepID=S8E3C5_FOMSC|nr:hypothetical protein FOMPIDRAFT_89175 [Fomitopsis schrenkii]
MAVPDRSIPVASSRRPDKDSSFEEGAAVVLGTSHKHVFLEYQERVNLVQDLMKDSRYTGVQEEFESFDCIPAFVCGYVKTNHWARTVYNYTRNDKWGPQLLQVKAGAAGPKPPVDECPDLCELDQKLLAQLVNKECAVKGKGQDGATGGDDYKGNGDDAVLDQCVFVHYARIKARLQEQSATRSPRSDSGELDNESEVVGSIFMETDSADMKVQYPDDQYEHNMNEGNLKEYDPVAFLLDYILKFTAQREPEVKFAAASDLDLIELCKVCVCQAQATPDSQFKKIYLVFWNKRLRIYLFGAIVIGMLDLSKEKKEDEKKEGEGARGDPLSLFS